MNNSKHDGNIWIEDLHGDRYYIGNVCHLGRSDANDIVVGDPLVSRHHAAIQIEDRSGSWVIVDFGSRNGTYLNQQRITQPSKLKNGDQLRIGGSIYIFNDNSTLTATDPFAVTDSEQTRYDVRKTNTWLLVADIIGSTELVSNTSLNELPLITGKWLEVCRTIIENYGGRINQFMGDGFFAYWHDKSGSEANIIQTMYALQQQQIQYAPNFRFVVHFGSVVLGGVTIGEEERISGDQVHFVFRMEKLAGQMQAHCLLSDAAQIRLATSIPTEPAGKHMLPGFKIATEFFVCMNHDKITYNQDQVKLTSYT